MSKEVVQGFNLKKERVRLLSIFIRCRSETHLQKSGTSGVWPKNRTSLKGGGAKRGTPNDYELTYEAYGAHASIVWSL